MSRVAFWHSMFLARSSGEASMGSTVATKGRAGENVCPYHIWNSVGCCGHTGACTACSCDVSLDEVVVDEELPCLLDDEVLLARMPLEGTS